MFEHLFLLSIRMLPSTIISFVGIIASKFGLQRFGMMLKVPLGVTFIILWLLWLLSAFLFGVEVTSQLSAIALLIFIIGIFLWIASFVFGKKNKEPMNPKIVIRNETDADVSAITEVTVAAFKTLEISNHTEQFIIAALRAAKALTVSLVAEMDGRVIGHIAFSPVTISDGTRNWYGLGPVSVLPEYQRQGIGKALIQEGLSRLREMKALGCCLVGHPAYYGKFGFRNVPGLGLEGVPPEVFFALSFDGHTPQGSVAFHEGFRADGQPEGA